VKKITPLTNFFLPRLLLLGLLFLGARLSAQMSLEETLDSAKSLRLDRADEKEVLLRKCLNLLDNEEDSLHHIVEFALGRLCYYTGQLDSAYAHFTAAQEFTEDSTELRCSVLNSRGATLHRWGKPKEATELFIQGIELSRAIDDSLVIPMMFNNMANCQQDLGNLGNAKKYMMRAIKSNARLGDSIRLASFAHSAKLELLHLEYEGSEKPVHCLLDAQLLHSILHNLIGNSLKFTPSGGHIVVSVEQKSDRGIIRVRDTGSGMTQDQVKAIFKPFQQVSEEKEKRRVGTGLGLSIVSQFTQLMSGTVDVESQKGEGTTFTLSFPLQA